LPGLLRFVPLGSSSFHQLCIDLTYAQQLGKEEGTDEVGH
jgi:hypothetical protein